MFEAVREGCHGRFLLQRTERKQVWRCVENRVSGIRQRRDDQKPMTKTVGPRSLG